MKFGETVQMAIRICGELMDNERQHISIALRKIYGVGSSRANKTCDTVGVERSTRVKDVAEDKLAEIRKALEMYTLQGDLRRDVAMNIKALRDLGSYRGRRHRMGLPSRGQKTKTNAKTCKRRRGRT
jgi:small subunit ribosomal protein S13